MGTTQLIIVFFALMALISLVTIGIDWVGKPLRNRRFIPRIYRFDDEKLPIDAYGNTSFEPAQLSNQAPPIVVAQLPPQPMASPPIAPRRRARADKTVPVEAHTPSRSAFSDTLASPAIAPTFLDAVPDSPATPTPAGSSPAGQAAATNSSEWRAGMALDASINDRKPNLAAKAERFWQATAQDVAGSHFDAEDRDRMQQGKAPRRHNPRTGRTETMELTGLRTGVGRCRSANELARSFR